MTNETESIVEKYKNVTLLEKDNKKYYIIGTAHISQKSVEEVAAVIDDLKPDTVCVELCETRYKTLTESNQWESLNIINVIKEGKALMLMANLALSSFQRKMGEQMGVKPGEELREGVRKADEIGAKLVLADRDIQVTLKRTWANLSFFNKIGVMSGLLESVFANEELSEEELEKMKERDHLSDMMEEFAKAMPRVKGPLIDERDQYLMSKIEEAEGDTIVAVVGAGHVAGMVTHFNKVVDRETITVIPPPSRVTQTLKWLIPILVLSLFGWGFYKHRGDSFESMLYAWILPNVIGTAIFSLVARPKFLTWIIGSLSAPLTSLNPTIGAGMVAGFVEALLRKPTVAECQNIPEDIKTLGGFYKNGFTRVLLVFVAASLGSSIGTMIAVAWLSTFLPKMM